MKTIRYFAKGFNYSQDGPGNRLVYHLKGCNMRCPWCSNPEGMFSDRGNCETVSTNDIITEVISCRPMFFDGGGVTFTGGEATLQIDPLKVVLKELREQGIHTAIETNATSDHLNELFCDLSCLIADLKHPNDEIHRRITGVSNERILQNLRLAAESGIDLLIRIPLIGGFNTDEESLRGFSDFFRSIARENVRFEMLKYHEYGKDKWKKLGLTYTVENAQVTEDTRKHFEETFRTIGLNVVRT